MEKSDLTYRDYARLARLPLDELAAGCEAQAFHASGPGGQCVNTTDSAVRMTHRATGITVTSRESRSQYRNRQLCLQKIRAELERRAGGLSPFLAAFLGGRKLTPAEAEELKELIDQTTWEG